MRKTTHESPVAVYTGLFRKVHYLLQFHQMIDFKDEIVNDEENANFVKIDLKKQFADLSDEQKTLL